MQEVELTSARLLRVWWAFAWRFAGIWVLLLSVATLAGLLSAWGMTEVMNVPHKSVVRMASRVLIATMIAGVPVAGVMAVRAALSGRFGSFRLALLPAVPAPDGQPRPAAQAPSI